MLVKSSTWGTKAYCSGAWVNKDHIVTAKHCVTNDNNEAELGYEVEFQTYKEFEGQYPYNKNHTIYNAKVIGFLDDVDIAILKSENDVSHGIARIRKDTIKQGLKVHTLSHPVNMMYNYTQGMVSQVRDMDVYPGDEPGRYYVLHVTASATYGSSGSGLFDDNGDLLGIACFISTRMPGAIFYLHRDLLVEVLEKYSVEYY